MIYMYARFLSIFYLKTVYCVPCNITHVPIYYIFIYFSVQTVLKKLSRRDRGYIPEPMTFVPFRIYCILFHVSGLLRICKLSDGKCRHVPALFIYICSVFLFGRYRDDVAAEIREAFLYLVYQFVVVGRVFFVFLYPAEAHPVRTLVGGVH